MGLVCSLGTKFLWGVTYSYWAVTLPRLPSVTSEQEECWQVSPVDLLYHLA